MWDGSCTVLTTVHRGKVAFNNKNKFPSSVSDLSMQEYPDVKRSLEVHASALKVD